MRSKTPMGYGWYQLPNEINGLYGISLHGTNIGDELEQGYVLYIYSVRYWLFYPCCTIRDGSTTAAPVQWRLLLSQMNLVLCLFALPTQAFPFLLGLCAIFHAFECFTNLWPLTSPGLVNAQCPSGSNFCLARGSDGLWKWWAIRPNNTAVRQLRSVNINVNCY